MDINRKTRKQLKEFFVKNAIPTESNFADLIDAGLNQMDDGVAKPDGSPLCIASSGDTQKAINFYTSFADPDPAWSLTLNPRSKADDPTSAREGFAVTDGAGMARLFIDRQGNLGVGTQTPDRRLVIARSGNDTEVSVNDHLFLDGSGGTVRVTNNALISNGGWALKDNTKRAFTLEIRDTGMLELYGTVTVGRTDWRKMATFDAPNNKVAFPSGNVEVSGELKVSKLQLGNKWLMSGIGDAHGNDDWLRLFNTAGTGYHGGLAAGRLWTSSGSLSGSDARMKTDIRSLGSSIDRLCRLRGVSFQRRADDSEGGPRLGLIAQEVEPVFPELVGRGPDGMKGVDYGGFIAPVIEAIKDLRDQIEDLKRSATT